LPTHLTDCLAYVMFHSEEIGR